MTASSLPAAASLRTVLNCLAHGESPPSMWAPSNVVAALATVKASRVARDMHLDESVISLWRQHKRPIPGPRIVQLFEVLEELMDFDPSFGLPPEPEPIPEPIRNPLPELRTRAASSFGHASDLLALALVPWPADPGPAPPSPADMTTARTPPSDGRDPAPPPRRAGSPALYVFGGIPSLPLPLRWCTSTHGTGIQRIHHHGPSACWAPRVVTRIEDL